MKLIHKFKSPNFNERKSDKINLIIIHYTALKSVSESIKYLCLKKNKVSSHYLISEIGQIYNLVPEKKRAWHAGKSYWKGVTDINSESIGIELDYSPISSRYEYNEELIFSLIKLLKILIKKYKIQLDNILGHSDIAPYRKIDPGEMFPWNILEKNKLAFEIKRFKEKHNLLNLLENWYIKYRFKSHKKKILFMLDYIGYDISSALTNKLKLNQLFLRYSDRFNHNKNRFDKKNILDVVQFHFLNILLTKLKK